MVEVLAATSNGCSFGTGIGGCPSGGRRGAGELRGKWILGLLLLVLGAAFVARTVSSDPASNATVKKLPSAETVAKTEEVKAPPAPAADVACKKACIEVNEVANDSVTTAKLAPGSVTLSKLAFEVPTSTSSKTRSTPARRLRRRPRRRPPRPRSHWVRQQQPQPRTMRPSPRRPRTGWWPKLPPATRRGTTSKEVHGRRRRPAGPAQQGDSRPGRRGRRPAAQAQRRDRRPGAAINTLRGELGTPIRSRPRY